MLYKSVMHNICDMHNLYVNHCILMVLNRWIFLSVSSSMKLFTRHCHVSIPANYAPKPDRLN